jgi:hypothetical protein
MTKSEVSTLGAVTGIDLGIGNSALGILWSLGIGHWSLRGIGNSILGILWSLGFGPWSLLGKLVLSGKANIQGTPKIDVLFARALLAAGRDRYDKGQPCFASEN